MLIRLLFLVSKCHSTPKSMERINEQIYFENLIVFREDDCFGMSYKERDRCGASYGRKNYSYIYKNPSNIEDEELVSWAIDLD